MFNGSQSNAVNGNSVHFDIYKGNFVDITGYITLLELIEQGKVFNTGTIVGIIVGSIALVFIIVGIVMLISCLYKRVCYLYK